MLCQGILIIFVGCTLFTDKTMSRVPVSYLHYLENLDRVHTYVWGAAVLAYLYRQLGFANRSEVRQIIEYLTLMEGWIYEYFSGIVPHWNIDY